MCGRYQFTEPQNADLRRILQDVRRRCGDRAQDFRFGDVMPTAAAPVLIANGGKVVADLQTWGIPGWKGGLMINARAETVCEKPMFRRSMAAQRCVIPATSFYEWDAARHKYQFALPGEPLYLAGLYDNVDGANRFVILTTTPNASMHGIRPDAADPAPRPDPPLADRRRIGSAPAGRPAAAAGAPQHRRADELWGFALRPACNKPPAAVCHDLRLTMGFFALFRLAVSSMVVLDILW